MSAATWWHPSQTDGLLFSLQTIDVICFYVLARVKHQSQVVMVSYLRQLRVDTVDNIDGRRCPNWGLLLVNYMFIDWSVCLG